MMNQASGETGFDRDEIYQDSMDEISIHLPDFINVTPTAAPHLPILHQAAQRLFRRFH